MVYGFSPYWINSILGIEWYVFCTIVLWAITPLLVKKVNDVSRSVSLTAICIPICLGMNVMLKIINPIGNQEIWNGFVGGLNFFYHLPSIFVGCVIFNIEKHGFINNLAAKNARVTSYCLLAGCICIFFLLTTGSISYEIVLWDTVFGIAIISQFFYETHFISNALLRLLGRRSYEIYLSHILFIQLMNRFCLVQNHLLDWIAKYCLICICSLLFGLMFNELFKYGKTVVIKMMRQR